MNGGDKSGKRRRLSVEEARASLLEFIASHPDAKYDDIVRAGLSYPLRKMGIDAVREMQLASTLASDKRFRQKIVGELHYEYSLSRSRLGYPISPFFCFHYAKMEDLVNKYMERNPHSREETAVHYRERVYLGVAQVLEGIYTIITGGASHGVRLGDFLNQQLEVVPDPQKSVFMENVYGKVPLAEIARRRGVSRERIRQLHNKVYKDWMMGVRAHRIELYFARAALEASLTGVIDEPYASIIIDRKGAESFIRDHGSYDEQVLLTVNRLVAGAVEEDKLPVLTREEAAQMRYFAGKYLPQVEALDKN